MGIVLNPAGRVRSWERYLIVAYRKRAAPLGAALQFLQKAYSVDSISKPQASSKGSGMYFEFLLRRAHSRRRVDRRY